MNVKIIKALSKHGYIHSKTNLFPDYLTESGVSHPGIKKMLNDLNIGWTEIAEVREKDQQKTNSKNEITKYADIVSEFNIRLKNIVSNSIEDSNDFPLIIGGDHSSSIGSIAGILKKRPNLGVLWIDAHSDIHTPETTETGWIYGMPVAVILGHGDKSLVKVMDGNFIKPQNICIFGARYIEKGEMENIKKWGVNIITMDDIDEKGIVKCFNEAMDIVTKNSDHLHISLDIDVIDKLFAPGATEPTQGGLTFREINFIARKLGQNQVSKSMDLVEGEPDKDINFQTGRLCLQIVANILGEKYSEYEMYLEKNKINA